MPHKPASAVLLLLFLSASLPAEESPPRKLPLADHREVMLEQAFGLKLDAMRQSEVAKSEAKYLRNLYQALIDEGFTEEEAFEIVVHHQSLLLNR